MKTIFEHIEHIKGKPHHVRKQVAFGVAASASALVAIVWFSVNAVNGSFAMHESNFAMSMGQAGIATTSVVTSQSIAGAAAAVRGGDSAAHIEIIDATSAAASSAQSEQTTIPF